jgi:hypothetical protein
VPFFVSLFGPCSSCHVDFLMLQRHPMTIATSIVPFAFPRKRQGQDRCLSCVLGWRDCLGIHGVSWNQQMIYLESRSAVRSWNQEVVPPNGLWLAKSGTGSG